MIIETVGLSVAGRCSDRGASQRIVYDAAMDGSREWMPASVMVG